MRAFLLFVACVLTICTSGCDYRHSSETSSEKKPEINGTPDDEKTVNKKDPSRVRSADPQIKSAQDTYWSQRQGVLNKTLSVEKQELPKDGNCLAREYVKNSKDQVVQQFSWSKINGLEVTKWVYLSPGGKPTLILSGYQRGKDRLEIKMYFKDDGSEYKYQQDWVSTSGATPPSWAISKEDVMKSWVPGC